MSKIRFIDNDYIKKNSTIDYNVDEDKINPLIDKVQDLYLQQIMGTNFMNDIKDKVANASLSTIEETLIRDYIQPYVKEFTVYEIIPSIQFNLTNKAISLKNSDNSNPTDLEGLRYLRNDVKNSAEFYGERLIRFLEANCKEFPLYASTSTNNLNPTKTSYFGGIYLDNADEDCVGCGSTSGVIPPSPTDTYVTSGNVTYTNNEAILELIKNDNTNVTITGFTDLHLTGMTLDVDNNLIVSFNDGSSSVSVDLSPLATGGTSTLQSVLDAGSVASAKTDFSVYKNGIENTSEVFCGEVDMTVTGGDYSFSGGVASMLKTENPNPSRGFSRMATYSTNTGPQMNGWDITLSSTSFVNTIYSTGIGIVTKFADSVNEHKLELGQGVGLRFTTTSNDVNKSFKTPNVTLYDLPVFADDVAAGIGGLNAGVCYRTATGELRIKL